ncbi:MAG: polynucleotide adenylyltransferase PcnB, partial [Acidobacteria bacterium]|nr:polynucleotide adenylyltransferase PcnB [Acidobacteriota bacterium]
MTLAQPSKSPDPRPSITPRRAAARVAAKLRERGFQAYFVGGCVRDLLRGEEPKDWDIATDACPDEVLRQFPHSLL